MPYKVLIMGLPGSGKTTLASALIRRLDDFNSVTWLNADVVRQEYNDWDFSEAGRLRQAHRMADMANASESEIVIADFVAPLPEMRYIYDADLTVWVDTIRAGRFEDTNKAFVPPAAYDFRVDEQDSEFWSNVLFAHIAQDLRRSL